MASAFKPNLHHLKEGRKNGKYTLRAQKSFTSSAEVTGQGQLQATPQGDAVHRRDGRHGQQCCRRITANRGVFTNASQVCTLSVNVFYPTYLSHEGSQAVNKQIGLSVVHQSSLFQVGTYLFKMTHHHTPYSDRLGSRASGVPEDTHLRKKHPALNS